MSRIAPISPPNLLAVFDLDGTLTWRDTLLPFVTGYLRRHPARLARFWRAPWAGLRYALDRDRGELKSRVLRMAMGGDSRDAVNAWADEFVAAMRPRGMFRPAALAVLEEHRAAGHRLVLLSASPDLYVPRIGTMLGFERTLCTDIRWHADRLDGALLTPNRYGEEKVTCLQRLRVQYGNIATVAYGNSESDLPHMRIADRALLVNAKPVARRAAKSYGIPIGEWT